MKNSGIIGTFITTLLALIMSVGIGGRILAHAESFAEETTETIASVRTPSGDSTRQQIITQSINELERSPNEERH